MNIAVAKTGRKLATDLLLPDTRALAVYKSRQIAPDLVYGSMQRTKAVNSQAVLYNWE